MIVALTVLMAVSMMVMMTVFQVCCYSSWSMGTAIAPPPDFDMTVCLGFGIRIIMCSAGSCPASIQTMVYMVGTTNPA